MLPEESKPRAIETGPPQTTAPTSRATPQGPMEQIRGAQAKNAQQPSANPWPRDISASHAADAPVLDDDFRAWREAANLFRDGGVFGGVTLAELLVKLNQLLPTVPPAP